jgi:phage-related holin
LVDEYLLMMDAGIFRTAIVFFYISNEGISILENAHAIGLPIPTKLKMFLKQLKGGS